MIWISTKPNITHMEGINVNMNKYAYKYVCILCGSLIIVKFGSLLQFGKTGCFTRFVAYPVTKPIFHNQDQTNQLNCKPHHEYTTAKLVLSCLFRYKKKNISHFTLLHVSFVSFSLEKKNERARAHTHTHTHTHTLFSLHFTRGFPPPFLPTNSNKLTL
jgi:hypothetical protein